MTELRGDVSPGPSPPESVLGATDGSDRTGAERKSLVYFSTRTFWRPSSGHEVMSFNYCRYLHEELGYDIHVLAFLGPGQSLSADEAPDFLESVHQARLPGRARVLLNLIQMCALRRLPFQAALYADRSNSRALDLMVSELQPCAVLIDMIRLAPYLDSLGHYKGKKILCLDDLLSTRYREQLRVGGAADFAGNYAGPAKGATGWLRGLRFIRNAVLRSESRRVERAELRYTAAVDAALVVSKAEAKLLNARTGIDNTYVTAMGVDVDYFSSPVDLDVQHGTAAFVGNLAYGPNVDSLRLIRDKVLPRMKTSLRMRVIGDCPAEVAREFADDPRFELLGRVEDMRPVVRASSMVLAPIAYGSGVKTKIVEAMAMGMCVLTNSVGAQSIDIESGVHLIVEDDPAALAARADAVLADDAERSRLGANASTFAERNCRWPLALAAFREFGL